MRSASALDNETIVKITSKGQVFLSKAIREKVGLEPGGSVGVSANEQGEVVLRPVPGREETTEERRARVHAALVRLSGKYGTGRSTDEIMRDIRGDWVP